MDKPLFETWSIIATKLKIFEDRIEVGRFFGLNKMVISKEKINSVHKNFLGTVVVTTIGGEDYNITPWLFSSRNKVYSLLQSN